MMLPRSPRPRRAPVLEDIVGAAGMHQHQDAELRGLRPERIVFRQRQVLAVHVAANRGAAQPQPLDAVLQLLSREIGMLQRDRRERDKAIRVGSHPLREPFVLDLHDPAREVTIGGVPPVAIDAERLDVEPLFVHDLQACGAQHAVVPAAAASATASAALLARFVPLTTSATSGTTQ